jgi:hypothetical protein
LCGRSSSDRRPSASIRPTFHRRTFRYRSQVDGATIEPFLLNGVESRTQLVIGRDKLGLMASTPIGRLALRRDAQLEGSLANGWRGGWVELEIRASWTSRDPKDPSASFSANHGAGEIVVFNGPYRVIDSPRLQVGAKVASFDPTVSPNIVLKTPIQPQASGNLCLEFLVRKHATEAAPQQWALDMEQPAISPRSLFGRPCWQHTADLPSEARILSTAAVGGTLTATTRGPNVNLALLFLGASRSQWGAIALPLDLTLVGAPGCTLYVSGDFIHGAVLQPLANVSQKYAALDLEVPAMTALVGAPLHTQWFFLHPQKNALNMSATGGASVLLAAAPVDLGVGMVQALDPSATTGRVYVQRAPVLMLAPQ